MAGSTLWWLPFLALPLAAKFRRRAPAGLLPPLSRPARRGAASPHMRTVLVMAAIALAGMAPGVALATTTIPVPTPTPSCAPWGTPHCAAHCDPDPCPTIRDRCFARSCGGCIENPVCGPGQACEPAGLGGCCSCATFTATPVGPSPTPTPSGANGSPSPAGICDVDCNGDGAIAIDELVAAVKQALTASLTDGCASFD